MAAHFKGPNLTKLISPTSIAVVGASSNESKLGYVALKNVIDSGFDGLIFPVNPKSDQILELKCYKSVSEIPEVPDLVVVAIPSKFVNNVVKESAEKGVKDFVVFSAGYKEIGKDGVKLENELIELAKNNELNILGPNCLGFVNTKKPLNATFAKANYKEGNLRIISQSGAIASAMFDWADNVGLGYDQFLTLGNKASLNENDVLAYWLEHDMDEYHPIGMYLESIVQGERFIDLVSEITLEHPVFVLKPGKSDDAKKAMQSHTGSIAGEDYVLDAALQKAGAIRCNGLSDLFNLSKTFSWCHELSGNNIAIISNAGGPAVISTDLLNDYGLSLANLSENTKKDLENHLPRAANINNPVDVLGDALADRYEAALDAVLQEENVNGVIAILTPQVMTQIEETAKIISEMSEKHSKPILATFIGGSDVNKGEKYLNEHRIPAFKYPERAIMTFAKMWEWQKYRTKKYELANNVVSLLDSSSEQENKPFEKVQDMLQNSFTNSVDSITVNEIMSEWDIKIPPYANVKTYEECLKFSENYNWPVVLKISAAKALHKTELGGVITDISNENELKKHFEKILETSKVFEDSSIQIQKQIKDGVELILGFKKDSVFGNVLMFGAGGTLAELIEDRNLGILPLDYEDIVDLVEQSKVYKLLSGYRGQQPYNLESLYNLIQNVVSLAEHFDNISEFEINPVIVTQAHSWAVDGKMLLKEHD